jgi:hypothetical protein
MKYSNWFKKLICWKILQMEYHIGQQVHLSLKHRRHYDGDKCTFQFKMDQLSRRLAKDRRKFRYIPKFLAKRRW